MTYVSEIKFLGYLNRFRIITMAKYSRWSPGAASVAEIVLEISSLCRDKSWSQHSPMTQSVFFIASS
jgi:hypothetical protein